MDMTDADRPVTRAGFSVSVILTAASHLYPLTTAFDLCDRTGAKDDPVHQRQGLLAVHLRRRHRRKLAH